MILYYIYVYYIISTRCTTAHRAKQNTNIRKKANIQPEYPYFTNSYIASSPKIESWSPSSPLAFSAVPKWNIYVIETKCNGSAQNALNQINERGYADAFKTDGRPIVKLGLNFSEEKRIIDDFAVE